MNQPSLPTIILGGGFVGLFTALQLSQANYPRPLILIESRDRFTFKPLLYELLTDELHSEQVCPLYRDLLAGSRITLVQDTVDSIDLQQHCIYLNSGQSYHYGKLVLAPGSRTTYFNIPGAAENSLPFTSSTEALTLKMRLQDCLETASQTREVEGRALRVPAAAHLLTVAIIGAGPAGVELACTLADLLPVLYDQLGGDYEEIRIVLVNRSNEILKGDINSRLRQAARKSLSDRTVDVELLLEAAVTEITPDGVEYVQQGQRRFLPAMTVVWTGGTEPNPLLRTLAVTGRNKRGQLMVKPTLQLPEYPDVFVGGDCADVMDAPQPPTAQVAYQQGKAIAANLIAIAKGEPPTPMDVHLRGTLMKLGMGEGVANLFDQVELKGELGHLIRQATYLELLPTPKRNFQATVEWLTDEIFQRHQPTSLHPKQNNRTPLLAGMTATLASVMLAVPLIWRAAQPEQFKQQMTETGLPSLLERMTTQSGDR